jgi:DNA-binding transcriptional LysR family regulator
VPLLREFDAALAEIEAFRAAPSGTVRINAPPTAAQLLLREVVPRFRQRYPQVAIDIVTEGRFVDIVADGFDAGVRLGEAVPQDMVAVAFGGPARFVAVAAPAYLARAGTPLSPDDLRKHECIRHRMPSGKLYRWEFQRRGQDMVIEVPGKLTLDHLDLMLAAAVDGHGIAYIPYSLAAHAIGEGRLAMVLGDWCPQIPGLFLYYPGHRQVPAGLRAFIDTMREAMP